MDSWGAYSLGQRATRRTPTGCLRWEPFFLALLEVRWNEFSNSLVPIAIVGAATLPVGIRGQRPVLAAWLPYLAVVAA